jgi:hypothetical protein
MRSCSVSRERTSGRICRKPNSEISAGSRASRTANSISTGWPNAGGDSSAGGGSVARATSAPSAVRNIVPGAVHHWHWPLDDGFPHEMRAADYDDWVTETTEADGKKLHGLNGDILVWNHVTPRRHELSSMGIRVNAETLKKQLEMSGQTDFLKFPYHQGIIKSEIPLSVGGGIGQVRTMTLLLRKAHLGEVTVSVWPKVLKEICAKENIYVLDTKK